MQQCIAALMGNHKNSRNHMLEKNLEEKCLPRMKKCNLSTADFMGNVKIFVEILVAIWISSVHVSNKPAKNDHLYFLRIDECTVLRCRLFS